MQKSILHVTEKQIAWADQWSHSQTCDTLLAHGHSYPQSAPGAAGFPLQEVQHRQTGAVSQIPHCPQCWGETYAFLGALPRLKQVRLNTHISLLLSQILAYQLPRSTLLKTLQGSNLSISCGDNKEIVSIFHASTFTPYLCHGISSYKPCCACVKSLEMISDTKTQLLVVSPCQQPQNWCIHSTPFSMLVGL